MRKGIVETVTEISHFLTFRTVSAKSAGRKAYRMLISRNANPYVRNNPDMELAWYSGWDAAASEDTDRSAVGQAAQKLQRKFSRAGAA